MEEKMHIFDEYFEGTGYVSPVFMIGYFAGLIKKYGEKNVIKSNKFKRWREAHITAFFLLGLSEITGTKYWLGNNQDESTPDTYGISLEAIEKGIKRNILNIEIFEWGEYSKGDLVEAIENKLKNKKYPEYYCLLCLINLETYKRIDLRNVYQRLKNKNIRISEIWLFSGIADSSNDAMIVRIYPDFIRKNFEIKNLIQKNKDQKPAMIKMLKRGTGKKFIPMGEAILPFRPY